jgi:hypothetical protein
MVPDLLPVLKTGREWFVGGCRGRKEIEGVETQGGRLHPGRFGGR